MQKPKHPSTPGTKLRFRYILGLSIVGSLTVVSQLYIQTVITTQRGDANTINVAGRQRMLSQKIAKLALQIQTEKEPVQREAARGELEVALNIWKTAHEHLAIEAPSNSEKIRSPELSKAFGELQYSYDAIQQSASKLLLENSELGISVSCL